MDLHVAANVKSKLLVFLTDLITNCESELFSKNNLFTDDALLSQLVEDPLKIEDDVSFDFLNLPNTLEYISHSHSPQPQPQTSQQPQQQPKLQQNHQPLLSNSFHTNSTALPQVAQKSPALIPSQNLIASLPSLTIPTSSSSPLNSPQNTLESGVIHSSMQQRVTAPVCAVTQSPAAILLQPSGVGQSTQQQNQKASLSFGNIQNSVPGQQQIHLQSASATAAALQNSHIQFQLQALKHQKTVKQSSVQNQLLTLQSMRQLPTDNMQQVSTFCFIIKTELRDLFLPIRNTQNYFKDYKIIASESSQILIFLNNLSCPVHN